MDLRSVTEWMRKDMYSVSNRRAFNLGREQEPELSGFGDLDALLLVIRDRGERTVLLRDQLTRAIIRLHRSSESKLWSSVLLVTYYPLLRRVRSRLVAGRMPSDDLDQLVIFGFLTTISTMHLDSYRNISMGLQQRTERSVFQALGAEFKHERHMLPSGDAHGTDTPLRSFASRGKHYRDDDFVDSASLSLFLSRATRKGVSASALQVLSLTQDETLRAYCDRMGESERSYQRLKKQRTRAMKRLRAIARMEDDRG